MFPHTRFAVVTGVGLALGGLLLAGCATDPDAGTNGVGKLAPDKIEAKTRHAAEQASAVRLTGSVVSKGVKYHLDMRLKQGGGVGEVSQGGKTFQLLRVGKDLFLKADSDFYAGADKSAAQKLNGKYVKVANSDPAYAQLAVFTDMDVLLDSFFILDGKLATGNHGSVAGVRTIALTANGGTGGAVDVSLEGKPYPLRYRRAGNAGTIEMSDYNKDFALHAPDKQNIVDYGDQITSSAGAD